MSAAVRIIVFHHFALPDFSTRTFLRHQRMGHGTPRRGKGHPSSYKNANAQKAVDEPRRYKKILCRLNRHPVQNKTNTVRLADKILKSRCEGNETRSTLFIPLNNLGLTVRRANGTFLLVRSLWRWLLRWISSWTLVHWILHACLLSQST